MQYNYNRTIDSATTTIEFFISQQNSTKGIFLINLVTWLYKFSLKIIYLTRNSISIRCLCKSQILQLVTRLCQFLSCLVFTSVYQLLAKRPKYNISQANQICQSNLTLRERNVFPSWINPYWQKEKWQLLFLTIILSTRKPWKVSVC